MKTDTVIIERTFTAPADSVWKAITDLDRMKKWYFDTLKSFKPEAGFQTQFNVRYNDKDYVHIWTVTEVVPGKKISYDWRYGGYPGNSSVTFELFTDPDGKTTRLVLTHSGLATFLPDRYPELAQEEFARGWESIVGSSLKEFLETNH